MRALSLYSTHEKRPQRCSIEIFFDVLLDTPRSQYSKIGTLLELLSPEEFVITNGDVEVRLAEKYGSRGERVDDDQRGTKAQCESDATAMLSCHSLPISFAIDVAAVQLVAHINCYSRCHCARMLMWNRAVISVVPKVGRCHSKKKNSLKTRVRV